MNPEDYTADLKELATGAPEKYVLPQLGDVLLVKISPTTVRTWHAELLRTAKPTPTRQSYSLRRVMLNAAVTGEVLLRNPYTMRGAAVSRFAERSVATLAQVQALADAVPASYRMLILLAESRAHPQPLGPPGPDDGEAVGNCNSECREPWQLHWRLLRQPLQPACPGVEPGGYGGHRVSESSSSHGPVAC